MDSRRYPREFAGAPPNAHLKGLSSLAVGGTLFLTGPRGEHIGPANLIKRNAQGGRNTYEGGGGLAADAAVAAALEDKGPLFNSSASLFSLAPSSGSLKGLV